MVAFPIPQRLKLPLAPVSAVLVAAFVAAGFLFVPTPILEAAVLDSGIAALLPAAAPPLGETARLALAVTASAGAGAAAWLAAFLILGGEGVVTLGRRARAPAFAPPIDVPVLRRADAHPDAPARAPLMAARDLGAPFLDIRAPVAAPVPPVERKLPRDLDAPLAAFDPSAIPDEPAEPVPAVPSLCRYDPPEPVDRIETFELIPPIAAPRTDATIHALLDRLERGVARRAENEAPPRSLDSTLSDLRRLATN